MHCKPRLYKPNPLPLGNGKSVAESCYLRPLLASVKERLEVISAANERIVAAGGNRDPIGREVRIGDPVRAAVADHARRMRQ
ncbi:hypothetical protein NDR87_31975 [Nocardia sp. CDC159]|uniref:Uncharacterized protein n=1 Tax=Nocardia pulmonis TaxID=2951408 RepID=A0A9X2EET9_9NOCA|nr:MULTISPECIES: hypothetical protein [Nocardia]MCM6778110.1 hypothetical protein [Nocardia pulmonis]MCM6790999.1 hypothetical protein [Nocardia sp. CDC159]